METLRRQTLIFISEAMFTYATDYVKIHLNLLVFSDFSLKFAESCQLILLLIFALEVVSIPLAVISESYVGKWYPTLVGLMFILFSGVCTFCLVFDFFPQKAAKKGLAMSGYCGLLLYMATSPIRTVLILEQIRLPNYVHKLENYVFFLVYVQLAGKALVLYTNHVLGGVMLKMNVAIVLLMLLTYCALFVFYFRRVFYIAPASQFVNEWYYFIVNCSSMKNVTPIVKPIDLPPPQEEIQPTMPTDQAAIPRINTQEKENVPDQSFWNTLYRMVPRYNTKEHVKTPTLVKLPSQANIEPVDEPKKLSNSVNSHTAQYVPTLVIIVGAAVVSFLDYFLMVITTFQSKIAKQDSELMIPVIEASDISLIMDLILFPIVHFFLIPLTRNSLKKEWFYFSLGYLFVLVSNVVLLQVENQIPREQFMQPNSTAGRVRFYNSLNVTVEISSYWLVGHVILASHSSVYLSKKINSSAVSETMPFRFVNSPNNISSVTNVTVAKGQTVVYVVFLTNDHTFKVEPITDLVENASALGNQVLAYYMVFTSVDLALEQVFLIFSSKGEYFGGEQVFQKLSNDDYVYSIERGTYTIGLKYEGAFSYGGILQTGCTINGENRYTIFLYTSKWKNNLVGKFVEIEEQFSLSYNVLFFQLFLGSVGRAYATVSFFCFFYQESPAKTRCLMASVMLFLNLFWLIGFHPLVQYQINGKTHMEMFVFAVVFVNCVLYLLINVIFLQNRQHMRKA